MLPDKDISRADTARTDMNSFQHTISNRGSTGVNMDIEYSVLDIGYSLLDIGYSVLDIGYSVLVIGYSLLDIGYSVLVIGYSLARMV